MILMLRRAGTEFEGPQEIEQTFDLAIRRGGEPIGHLRGWTMGRGAGNNFPLPVMLGDLFLEIARSISNPPPRPKRRRLPFFRSHHFDRFLDDS